MNSARADRLAVPDQVKSGLYDTKKRTEPTGAIATVTETLTAMSQLDPLLLDIAERNHTLAKLILDAAMKGR